MKCWKNSHGVKECGDKVPPEYTQQGYQELGKGGIVREETDRVKTKEELKKEKVKAEAKAQKQKEEMWGISKKLLLTLEAQNKTSTLGWVLWAFQGFCLD